LQALTGLYILFNKPQLQKRKTVAEEPDCDEAMKLVVEPLD
jgi:hypothetical protein